MIAQGLSPLLDWHRGRRRRALERVWRDVTQIQERALLALVHNARDTEFGLSHGLASVRSVADYQARVPIREYREFAPFLARAAQGERSVLWSGRTRDWVKTSGATGADKVIPVTREAFAAHRRGGWDAFLMAVERTGARHVMGGPMLLVGGRPVIQPIGDGGRLGDLSGLAVRRLPSSITARYAPAVDGAAAADWQAHLDGVAAFAARQDLRVLCGMPSWLGVFFEGVLRQRAAAGRPVRDLGQCWPNLRALVHGGIGFSPYAAVVDEWIGRRLEHVEIYPAAEAFVGVQTEATGGLSLMVDYGNFFEFVPVEDLGNRRPRRHTVADVELERSYAVVVSTPAGLWSYLLGDTVRFTRRDPLRLQITGRTRHYLNSSGENVTVEEVERAIVGACRRTEAEVVEFTVAPGGSAGEVPRAGHEWLVEFRVPPREPEDFARILDETVAAQNTEYRARRSGALGMAPPGVRPLPPGCFHRWLCETGKLGDRYKVPRVTNDRALADALLALAGDGEPDLALAFRPHRRD